MRCQAIFFDAVGTLIHPQPSAAEVYAQVGAAVGSRYALADIAKRFSAAFQREEEADRQNQWRTNEARERQRWHNIVTTVLDDVTDPAACFRILYDHFAQPQSWRCETRVLETLARLARDGCILGLASNYDHRLHSVIAGFPGLSCLRHVIVSSEVGWRKPAAQFFTAVCQSVGLPPEQILFVGDDRVNDYQGALAAGLQALLIDDALEAI